MVGWWALGMQVAAGSPQAVLRYTKTLSVRFRGIFWHSEIYTLHVWFETITRSVQKVNPTHHFGSIYKISFAAGPTVDDTFGLLLHRLHRQHRQQTADCLTSRLSCSTSKTLWRCGELFHDS
jgi:hypothetical protein